MSYERFEQKFRPPFQPLRIHLKLTANVRRFRAFRFSASRRPKPGFYPATRIRITSIQKFRNKLLHEFRPASPSDESLLTPQAPGRTLLFACTVDRLRNGRRAKPAQWTAAMRTNRNGSAS